MSQINRLSVKEYAPLLEYVRKEYPTARLTDKEFARQAGEALGNPKINEYHIMTTRECYGIPATKVVLEGEKTQTLDWRVAALEKRVQALENELSNLNKALHRET